MPHNGAKQHAFQLTTNNKSEKQFQKRVPETKVLKYAGENNITFRKAVSKKGA